MKRFTQVICLILVLSVMLAVPAAAAEITPYASRYFGSHSCYLYRVSGATFQVWFDVTGVRTMNEIGASTIKVQRSTDQVNWTTVQTYTKAANSQMICANTVAHASCVTHYGTSGYYYRALVEFYAKDASGSAYFSLYTNPMLM